MIISAYPVEKLAIITRVSSVLLPAGLGDLSITGITLNLYGWLMCRPRRLPHAERPLCRRERYM